VFDDRLQRLARGYARARGPLGKALAGTPTVPASWPRSSAASTSEAWPGGRLALRRQGRWVVNASSSAACSSRACSALCGSWPAPAVRARAGRPGARPPRRPPGCSSPRRAIGHRESPAIEIGLRPGDRGDRRGAPPRARQVLLGPESRIPIMGGVLADNCRALTVPDAIHESRRRGRDRRKVAVSCYLWWPVRGTAMTAIAGTGDATGVRLQGSRFLECRSGKRPCVHSSTFRQPVTLIPRQHEG
jgi:hypothetical protein